MHTLTPEALYANNYHGEAEGKIPGSHRHSSTVFVLAEGAKLIQTAKTLSPVAGFDIFAVGLFIQHGTQSAICPFAPGYPKIFRLAAIMAKILRNSRSFKRLQAQLT